MYENSNSNSYSSWTNNSGNSYTYITNHVTVQDSFNTNNSHNGRGGMCGLITLLAIVAPVLAGAWVLVSLITEVLR
ncbi:MAG: hypothetical protein ACOYNY_34970 [Caldilineaceae bacterium]|jgi:hypothetical protein